MLGSLEVIDSVIFGVGIAVGGLLVLERMDSAEDDAGNSAAVEAALVDVVALPRLAQSNRLFFVAPLTCFSWMLASASAPSSFIKRFLRSPSKLFFVFSHGVMKSRYSLRSRAGVLFFKSRFNA
eukprot:GDKK01028430.1.p2 GENE.GDKK01028430.1~~GDKK01028430.1.p2  ORF type:complete len:124 (-),score=13.78 GDKK01028430.1:47-418(-)